MVLRIIYGTGLQSSQVWQQQVKFLLNFLLVYVICGGVFILQNINKHTVKS